MVRPDLIAALTATDADVCPPNFTDHVFKTAHSVPISVRVWPAPSHFTTPRPFLLWTHGGGWIGGAHFTPRPWLLPAFHALGYHIIGNGYRLCPNVDVETSLNDCLDAVAWCRKELPGVIGEGRVDVERYGIVGESAGGHLVTLMATRLDPSPRVIIDIYGVVDLMDPRTGFATPPPSAYKPPSSPSTRDPSDDSEITEAEVLAALHDHDPSHALSDAVFSKADLTRPLTKNWKVDFPITHRIRLQLACQNYLATPGAKYVAFFHPERFSSHDEVIKFLKTMSPAQILEGEEYVSGRKKYPPTAFLHGTADEPVPVEQTYAFDEQLRNLGVETVVCIEEGGPHVFDHVYKVSLLLCALSGPSWQTANSYFFTTQSPDVTGWKEHIQPVVDFVQKHIEA